MPYPSKSPYQQKAKISAWRPFKAWVPIDIVDHVAVGVCQVFPSKSFRRPKARRS